MIADVQNSFLIIFNIFLNHTILNFFGNTSTIKVAKKAIYEQTQVCFFSIQIILKKT